MASPGFGAKQFDAAAAYVELLENLAPGVKDGTISGVVQLKDRTYDGVIRDLAPLDHVAVRIFNNQHSTEIVTGSDGKFCVTVPAQLLSDLAKMHRKGASWPGIDIRHEKWPRLGAVAPPEFGAQHAVGGVSNASGMTEVIPLASLECCTCSWFGCDTHGRDPSAAIGEPLLSNPGCR